ncbi:MAG: MATE family efflux transporter [Thermoanaerobaculia bacterium]|nr:MATE family efflux transporter [Thermoanaerobaculia bacterium]
MAAPVADRKAFDRTLVDGPIGGAVWKLAWPTMLQNVIGGLQGVVDHAMVGHFVGYAGNAGIGVAVQIFIVVFVFVASLFTGMSVLVARFAGADRPDQVNRTVYQAFLAALAFCFGILAPVGWLLSPALLELVHATPEVSAQALPYLRILFVSGAGLMLFHMFGAALRAAGDARTPLRLGVALTALNVAFNVVLIRGWGPIPALGTAGAALGTVLAGGLVTAWTVYLLLSGRLVVHWQRGMSLRPDGKLIKALFRLGLPTGVQGVAMNVAGVLLLRYIGSLSRSAEAQAAYAVGYTELFSLITWTSVGLMGATAAVVGQNLGAGRPERAVAAARVAARLGLLVAVVVGALFLAVPERLLALFGMADPQVVGIARQLLAFLSVSGLFVSVALVYTGALQGSGDTRSPLYITLASQIAVPLGVCALLDAGGRLTAVGIWSAIVLGHATRCLLSVWRFRQERWRTIDLGVAGAERVAP